jgi:valyl-tRNA synthetase
MPHITEELWFLLGFGKTSIQFAAPPQKIALDDIADVTGNRDFVSAIYEAVQTGRNLRAESKLHSNKRIGFILRTDEKFISAQLPTLTRLLNAEEVKLDRKYHGPAGQPVAVTPLGEIFLAIAATDKARERERLDKEIAKIENELRTAENKLKNKSFVDRAPAPVVDEHRKRLENLSAQLMRLKRAREELN